MDNDTKRNKKGQSLVETALVLPVLLLILTGIFDFGLLFNNYIMVTNASREGARSAAVGSDNAGITNAVKAVVKNLDSTGLTITITPDLATSRTAGVPITVTVKYKYKMVTPIIAALAPNPLNLASSTTMRCE